MSSSEEDVPAPSPSAAVVARRAGREAKSMREESGSDKDAEEPEEWDDDGEASSDEGESEKDRTDVGGWVVGGPPQEKKEPAPFS